MLGSGYVAAAEPPPSGGMPNDAAFIAGLSPAAWFRYGLGITVVTGVSQWNDQSGNARHLLQATGTAQPALQADNSILFDGTDDFLKCTGFTLNQPETVYVLFNPVTYVNVDYIHDGNTTDSLNCAFTAASPQYAIFAGAFVLNNNLTIGSYNVIASVYNGTSSVAQVNNTAPATGNAGAANAGGFLLGANANPGNFGNIQVKEAIVFAAAHDAPTRARVISYLGQVGQIPV